MPGKEHSSPEVLQKNLQRLIARCQELVGSKVSSGGNYETPEEKVPIWKLRKYVGVLESGIIELDEADHSNAPGVDKDLLKTLKLRRNILKQLVESRAKCAQDAAGSSGTGLGGGGGGGRGGILNRQVSTVDRGASQPGSLMDVDRRQVSERNELLGSLSDSSLTYRRSHSSRGIESDVEQVVLKHQELQDKIAEDMLTSIRALKNNTIMAKDTIVGDTTVLDQASKETDKNVGSLQHETSRLKEYRKTSCPWGVLLMLMVIFFVFFGMVLLIKVTK